jgi:thiamine-phosphate pyrophosphorylase
LWAICYGVAGPTHQAILAGLGEPQCGTVLALSNSLLNPGIMAVTALAAGVFDAWGVAPVGLAAVGAALLGLMFQRRGPRTTMPLPDPPLLLITDRRQAARPLDAVVEAALRAGCRWISLREKDLDHDLQAYWLHRLTALAHPWNARITLHGDPVLAAAAGVAGVHLPADGSPAQARAQLGPSTLIGQSVHNAAEAIAAARAGADYVVLGPIYLTASKPGYGPALGPDGLRRVAATVTIPVIALGGIEDASTAAACLHAGAQGVAVMGAVMRADDPAAVIGDLRQAFRTK